MKKFLWSVILICSSMSVAVCQTNNADSDSNFKKNESSEISTNVLPTETRKSAVDAVRIFKGRIADQPVTAKLKIQGGQISGAYSYDKFGKNIPLKGKIAANGKLKIEEFANGSSKPATATFTGEKYENYSPTTKFTGDWQKRGKKNPEYFFLSAVNLGENVQVAAKSINEKAKSYAVNATYPVFSDGAADYSKLNAFIRQTVNDTIKEFKTDSLKDCSENVKGGGQPCSLTGDFSVVYMNSELASVVYSDDAYLGGAHGSPEDHAVNFDLKTGKPLQLADIFKPGADFLKPISAYSINKLKAFDGFKDDPQSVEEGAAPKTENYKIWFLSPKGLTIGFAAYQVGAYAFGTPYVTIPFGELKDILKSDGVTAKFDEIRN